MPKTQQNKLGGRAQPGPAGELLRSPTSPSCNGGLLLSGGSEGEKRQEKRKGPNYTGREKGLLLRETEGRDGMEMEGREFPPKSM